MNQPAITSDIELHKRIMELNYLRVEQEQIIKRNVRELVYSVHPLTLLKNVANEFSGKEGVEDLKSIGLNLGKDFLMMKLFGKNKSVKSFLLSLVVKKATEYVVNHPDIITNGISKISGFFNKRSQKVIED